MAPSKPFPGPLRKLVLAFDVGTTFSGVSYAILDPGEVPKVQAVTRYPGQENGDFKIPSILYYTREGKVYAAGADAAASRMKLDAEDLDLALVQWFKLHLRPHSISHLAGHFKDILHPLPSGRTVVDVFSDFLTYLFSCARAFITESHANGQSLWDSVQGRIDFVLSHPNGWEGLQQSRMRQAAILAGLIPDTPAGHGRVHFVTEGEASFHFILDNGMALNAIKDGASIMIIDAGGGTVDLSTYMVSQATPISVEEITAPDCILQGSTRVNVRAQEFLTAKLRNSRYGNDEDIETMLEQFEKSAKVTFRNPNEKSTIKFGSIRDKDPNFGIRSGHLTLEGSEIAQLFNPSIDEIVEAVKKQLESASSRVQTAFLVGGFAASPYLFARLRELLKSRGMDVYRPDNHTNKAVAEGAVLFFLEHFVTVRVTKMAYGSPHAVYYDHTNKEHFVRRTQIYTRPSGRTAIPNGFSIFLQKGLRIRENEERIIKLVIETANPSALNAISAEVMCYKGFEKEPRWTDLEPDLFCTLCTVAVDISAVDKKAKNGSNGIYYQQEFNVVLLCGLTELKAQISWMQDSVEKRGPARIVYDAEAAT